MAHFSYTQLGSTGARITAGDLVLCEIIDLHLCHVRFAANGAILIGGDVGIALYWMQYANHQHPDRNAAARGMVKMERLEENRLQVRATGSNLAGGIESTVLLTVEFDPATKTYTYRFDAALKILPGKAWLEFDVQPDQLVQTAHFIPSGIWGRIYWYSVLPLHSLVFTNLARQILTTARTIDQSG